MEKDIMEDSSGVGLGLSLVILGIIVQFVFVDYDLAIWAATLLIGFGIAGLGIEMDKINPGAGYVNLGIGFLVTMLGVLLLNYFDLVAIKVLAMFVLLFGIYALITGVFDAVMYEMNSKDDKLDKTKEGLKIYVMKVIKIIAGVIGFLSNLSTVISNFGG